MDMAELDAAGLNTALSEATCLGIDIDSVDARVRIPLEVLTAPAGGAPHSRRLDVVLGGVGRIAASLRFHWWTMLEPEQTVLPLTLQTLNEAVQTFGGSALHGWEFVDPPESSWKQWAPLLSFDTALSEAPTAHVLEFTQQEGINNRELDVRVWFSDLTVEEPGGNAVSLPDFIEDGRRWWAAHERNDPATSIWHIAPPL
jgi:hypothetical protein